MPNIDSKLLPVKEVLSVLSFALPVTRINGIICVRKAAPPFPWIEVMVSALVVTMAAPAMAQSDGSTSSVPVVTGTTGGTHPGINEIKARADREKAGPAAATVKEHMKRKGRAHFKNNLVSGIGISPSSKVFIPGHTAETNCRP
jgi:hypothetical protein